MTIDEILILREEALFLNLIGSQKLLKLTPEKLQSIYNGIGPEWFPEELRKMIDTLHPSLRVVAMQHDVDFATGSGTWNDFCEINKNFEKNGRIVADASFAWYRPRRYIVRRQAKIFANLCQICGWKAYLAAIKKYEEEK